MGEGSGAVACIKDKLRCRRRSMRRTGGLWNSHRNGTVCNALIRLHRDFRREKVVSEVGFATAGMEPRRATCEASILRHHHGLARVLSLQECGDLARPHVEADCLYAVPAEWPGHMTLNSFGHQHSAGFPSPAQGAWPPTGRPFSSGHNLHGREKRRYGMHQG
jgi:hypothetical protein